MDLGPVDRITADAVGEPGFRTFYLQARHGDRRRERGRGEAAGGAPRGLRPGPARRPRGRDRARDPPTRSWRSRSRSTRGGGRAGCRSATTRTAISSCSRSRSSSPRSRTTTPARCSLEEPETDPPVGHARTDARALAPRRGGGRPRPPDLPVLREPDGPGRARVSRDERALQAGLSDPGRPRGPRARASSGSSGSCRTRPTTPSWREATMPATAADPRRSTSRAAARSPCGTSRRGRSAQREVAAYLVARELGWPHVPPTVLRDGPEGIGSAQLFVEFDPSEHYFTLQETHVGAFRDVALFDAVINNADRKGGHCLHRGRRHDLPDRPRRLLQRGREAAHRDLGVRGRADRTRSARGPRSSPRRTRTRGPPVRHPRGPAAARGDRGDATPPPTAPRRSARSRSPAKAVRSPGLPSDGASRAAAPRHRRHASRRAHGGVLPARRRRHDVHRRGRGPRRWWPHGWRIGTAARRGAARPCSPRVRAEIDAYFAGRLRDFSTPLDLGTLPDGFGRRVLEVTATIPFGELWTYGDVAGLAGSPRGGRAAGNALGRCPIELFVPCHRVVHAGGGIGGYGRHEERKRWLIAHEERS